MKQIIFPILASLFLLSFVGCKKDNRPPLVRANELLRKNHLPEMYEIDSVFGFENVRESLRFSYRLAYLRDSFRLISKQRELTEKEKQRMKECDFDSRAFYEQAEIHFREHLRKGDKEEFIGYECAMLDTASATSPGGITIYSFDKDFKKVQVTKKLDFVEDYD